jgi:hypothetical protein
VVGPCGGCLRARSSSSHEPKPSGWARSHRMASGWMAALSFAWRSPRVSLRNDRRTRSPVGSLTFGGASHPARQPLRIALRRFLVPSLPALSERRALPGAPNSTRGGREACQRFDNSGRLQMGRLGPRLGIPCQDFFRPREPEEHGRQGSRPVQGLDVNDPTARSGRLGRRTSMSRGVTSAVCA